mgnify:CR=1 FL=1
MLFLYVKHVLNMCLTHVDIFPVYNFVLEHGPGSKHKNADWLSRLRCKRSDCPDCVNHSNNHSNTDKSSDKIQIHPVVEQGASSDASENIRATWLDTWSREELRKFQNEDENKGPILTLKNNYSNQKPPKNLTKGSKALWSQWEFLEIRDELLYKKSTCRNSVELRLEAPN